MKMIEFNYFAMVLQQSVGVKVTIPSPTPTCKPSLGGAGVDVVGTEE
jgi:hypothetical protein